MSQTATSTRDDAVTVAAIGVLAACIVTVDHEAIGHGAVCLLSGGRITLLTSVYFHCSVGSPFTAIGGPLGNLLGAAIAWALSRVVSDRAVHMRPLLLLITAFGVFSEAGYVIDSMRRAEGDWAFALTDNGIPLSLPWRIGGVALGIALYAVGIRATVAALTRMGAANTRARMLLRLPWLAGTIFAVIAALFYTPSPFAAVKDAALEIGAAAWPLLVIPFRLRATATGAEPAIDRSLPWLAAATLGYIAFVLTLGRGIFTG